MCDWGNNTEIEITRRISVDSCLAEEIVYLNENDVRTEACCCGHGKAPGSITIRAADQQAARQLGYDPRYPDACEQGDPVRLGIMEITPQYLNTNGGKNENDHG